jgi:hypothetical protein
MARAVCTDLDHHTGIFRERRRFVLADPATVLGRRGRPSRQQSDRARLRGVVRTNGGSRDGCSSGQLWHNSS